MGYGYSGLSPEEALQKWYAIRQKPQSQLTPQEAEDVAGNMTNLAKENPQAWALLKSGTKPSGDSRTIFNPQTGQWDAQKTQGFWSHPESWFQLAAGAGLGGLVAAPAIAGAMGGGAAAPGAMTGAEMSAGGLVGPGVTGAGAAGGGLLSTAAKLSGPLSALAGGRQAGREAEAQAQALNDRNRMAGEELNLRAPSMRGQQASQGDVLANAQDFAWGPSQMVGNIPVPSSTGGLRPSIHSQNTRDLGQQMAADALRGQRTNGGRVFDVTPLPKAGVGDSILNNAASFTGLLDAFRRPPVRY